MSTNIWHENIFQTPIITFYYFKLTFIDILHLVIMYLLFLTSLDKKKIIGSIPIKLLGTRKYHEPK